MAKQPDRDPNNEISAQNILNYLQTNNITNEIFLEILSEIKDKQGYKCLKKMVLDLISKHEGALYNPRTERSVRASIINEVCTIAFTIDTIFPNVIRMKLQNEVPNFVNSILSELKEEKEISIFISSGRTVYEKANNAVPITSSSNDSRQSPQASPKKKSAKKKSSITENKVQSLNSPNTEENTTTSDMPITPKSSSVERLSTSDKATTSSKSMPPNSVININKDSSPPKSGPFSTEAVVSFSNSNDKASSSQNITPEKNIFEDSDTESDISIGKDSIPSVSSVHTSELSSYDDAISVNSGDGTEKEKVSIHDIQKVWKTDRITAWCAENFNSPKRLIIDESYSTEETKMVKNEKISRSGSSSPTSSTFASEPSSPQRVLPRRARKPNSKYLSDSILCPMTQKQQKRMLESENTENEQIAASPIMGPLKKRKLKYDEENEESLINSSHAESAFEKKIVKTPLQNSPDVFKPFASIRPLTSRKTAPLTLYSTAKQNLKQ